MTGSKTMVVIGPLAAHAVEFDVRLAALGYARSARTDVQVAAAELSRWLAGSGLPMAGCLTISSRSSGDCRARGVACPALGLTRLVTIAAVGRSADRRPGGASGDSAGSAGRGLRGLLAGGTWAVAVER